MTFPGFKEEWIPVVCPRCREDVTSSTIRNLRGYRICEQCHDTLKEIEVELKHLSIDWEHPERSSIPAAVCTLDENEEAMGDYIAGYGYMRHLRVMLGMSQVEMAELLQTDQAAVSRLEFGQRYQTLSTAWPLVIFSARKFISERNTKSYSPALAISARLLEWVLYRDMRPRCLPADFFWRMAWTAACDAQDRITKTLTPSDNPVE